MRKSRLLLICMSFALVLGLSGCASGSGFSGTADKDSVILNITSEPTDLNSMRLTDTISQSILYHCMSGFTRLDENDNPVADLAESWDINDEKTIYTMHLKKDAKWSNGDAVTVNDFYYSWVQQMTPSTGTILASYLYNHIKNGKDFYDKKVDVSQLGLKVIDDYTLEIEWSHPMPNGLFYLSQPFYLPVNQKAYEKIGDKNYAKDADKIITNGAYTIGEWIHDDHLTLEKSKDYFDAKNIKIDKVKLMMIGDSNTALNAFKTGELDMTNLYGEQVSQIEEVDKEAVQTYKDGGSWYLDFNTTDKYLSNVNLRKAFAYSIDIQSLLDNVIKDGSIAADGFVTDTISGTNNTTYSKARGSLFAYNKEEAVKYLDKALEELSLKKEDLKLSFIQSDTTYNQNQAAYLQQQWKENLGLDVELKTLTSKALSEARVSGDYTFTVGGTGPSENDAIAFLENYQTGNPNNTSQYSNKEYDQLIKSSMQEGDVHKRQDMLIKAEKILIDDMAIGPMYFTCTKYALSKKAKGIVRTPFQFFNIRNANIK